MDYLINLDYVWLYNNCNMIKLYYDNYLIVICIELKYIEKYIYNICSNKKNFILRKRIIKSIYCIGIYIVYMRVDMVLVLILVYRYVLDIFY